LQTLRSAQQFDIKKAHIIRLSKTHINEESLILLYVTEVL
jgi:hypothetical protein